MLESTLVNLSYHCEWLLETSTHASHGCCIHDGFGSVLKTMRKFEKFVLKFSKYIFQAIWMTVGHRSLGQYIAGLKVLNLGTGSHGPYSASVHHEILSMCF